MLSEKIVNLIKEDKLSDAVSFTNNLLYSKLSVAIQEMYPDISSSVFEGKKAPKTDKEDDGEGMDPVGHGDSDIDNDGDSDESDDYLKNRRKAVGKAMKKRKNGDDDGNGDGDE